MKYKESISTLRVLVRYRRLWRSRLKLWSFFLHNPNIWWSHTTDMLWVNHPWLWYVSHHRIRVWWNSLWIPRDEFDHSLDIDTEALIRMPNEVIQQKYFARLYDRRCQAHNNEVVDEWASG